MSIGFANLTSTSHVIMSEPNINGLRSLGKAVDTNGDGSIDFEAPTDFRFDGRETRLAGFPWFLFLWMRPAGRCGGCTRGGCTRWGRLSEPA